MTDPEFSFQDYITLCGNPFDDYSKACVCKYLVASRVSRTTRSQGEQLTFTNLERQIPSGRGSYKVSNVEHENRNQHGRSWIDANVNPALLKDEHEALWNSFVRPTVSHALREGRYPTEFRQLGLFLDYHNNTSGNRGRLDRIFDPYEIRDKNERRGFITTNRRVLGEYACSRTPFSSPGTIPFFRALGFEMLLSITAALDRKSSFLDTLGGSFLETVEAIFRANARHQPQTRTDNRNQAIQSETTENANPNAAAVNRKPYRVLAETIQGLMSNRSSLSTRTYPSLFSKAVHSYQANSLDNDLFEPSETRDSQHREKFLSELEQWLDSLASEKDALTKAKISGGISDFKAYAKKTDARLGAGATGGRIGRRSWRLALNEEAHQRFCMWGGDFARLIAATTVSYCEQQGISESEDWGRHETACMEPTKIRDLGSLPALLLAVPFLGRSKRDEQKICLFLSHEEMSQYLDALGGENPTHDIGHVIDVGKHVAEDLQFKSRDELFNRLEEMGG